MRFLIETDTGEISYRFGWKPCRFK